MQFVGFQLYWPDWWHLWPHWSRIATNHVSDGLTSWYSHVFCFGPLQFRWMSGIRNHIVWWTVDETGDTEFPFYVRMTDGTGWCLDYGRFATLEQAVYYRDHVLPEAGVALLEEQKVFEGLSV